MTQEYPGRETWLVTYVGVLDTAFALSEDELYGVSEIVRRLLAALSIPERGNPSQLPMPVAHELVGGTFTAAIAGRTKRPGRETRPATAYDCVASLEAWRHALVGMLTDAYPDLTREEKLLATKVIADLLASLGVPGRAAAYHPQMVVAAHLQMDPPVH